MIHRLARRQLGDRRQHAEGIRRQHHDVLGMTGGAGRAGIGDRTRADRRSGYSPSSRLSSKFGTRVAGIDDDVLQHRRETVRGGPDLRLSGFRQPDRLRVAAALEIEDAVVRPAVLVVAQQFARGSAESVVLPVPERPKKTASFAVLADIRRAVHGHDVLARQNVVQEREHAFLDLAGVARAADEDDALREVARDDRLGARAVVERRSAEARQIDDGEFGKEALEFAWLRPAKKIANEERLPSILGYDTRIELVALFRARKKVLNEKLLVPRKADEVGEQPVEFLFRHPLGVVPPDRAFGFRVANDVFVFDRTAGVLTRLDDDRATRGKLAFAPADNVLERVLPPRGYGERAAKLTSGTIQPSMSAP